MKRKAVIIIILAFLTVFSTVTVLVNHTEAAEEGDATEENQDQEENATDDQAEDVQQEDNQGNGEKAPPPDESKFEQVAENDNLILKADPETGHFIVDNKKTGKKLRSFPNPDGWNEGGTSDSWGVHLQSPFMFSYVEFDVRKDVVKESSFQSQGGTADFKKIENGFEITYDMPNVGFVIPIEVKLEKDYVETRILGDEISDEKEFAEDDDSKDPKSRLVSLRLFPFLGAETSKKENGYIVLPDGPGALIDFQKDRASTNNLYSERVYGDDWAFSSKADFSSRQSIKMPTFGIKSENQTFLGLIEEGDVYANIVSAPSETLTQYNWATAEHLFRFKFFQPTNRKKLEGYFTYSQEMQREDRSVRYYLIDGSDPTYVDMAERYREYLMEEEGLDRLEAKKNVSLQLSLIGGGTKKGFIRDSFLPLTTAEQAGQIVKELNTSGVEDMSIHYYGWQRGGYDKNGGHFPVAKKLGGNDDMKKFVDFVHSKGFTVYLDASSYTYNNTNKDGFRPNRDAIRDLSSTVIKNRSYRGEKFLVSPKFMEKTILQDMEKAKELEVDGYLYGDGIGSLLSTDYNNKYFVNRREAKELQEGIIDKTAEELGGVHLAWGNFYGLQNVQHLADMDDDYSYDLFVDRKIPFAQIALHGLISYSFQDGNMGGNMNHRLLQGIEYGALPSFILTHEESQKLMESISLRRYYSSNYKQWENEIAVQYQSYNEALADVQDQFIVDHHVVAKGVYETRYENGKRILVNYNKTPYSKDDIKIEAEDFIILEGGR
ncbi:hypothetical protein J14TS2_53550 [Bacillus sp. J14TS2]|uniref:DUF5696 domain-containing protein n=1 Tax=Bacillus sp. J14TS2 TaxID=2807188 RepID=UPI001B1E1A7F|nr:DUF5696 domain-containing protein [Bacillus sp. J14TS2]GIN74880.1 hypothetical protein J14TS2_53550 [Bacillus sp. J14TS2]